MLRTINSYIADLTNPLIKNPQEIEASSAGMKFSHQLQDFIAGDPLHATKLSNAIRVLCHETLLLSPSENSNVLFHAGCTTIPAT